MRQRRLNVPASPGPCLAVRKSRITDQNHTLAESWFFRCIIPARNGGARSDQHYGPPPRDPREYMRQSLRSHDPNAGVQGGGIPPIVMVVHECSRGDRGSERAVAFARLTAEWLPRLVIPSAANGYFRATIRRAPALAPVWSWSLEWNQSYRLMGFLGYDEIQLQGYERRLPPL
jgi:hypothetical protein